MPKKARVDITNFNRQLTLGREATCWEGGQAEESLSPLAVPRTQRFTSVARLRCEPGKRRNWGEHFLILPHG